MGARLLMLAAIISLVAAACTGSNRTPPGAGQPGRAAHAISSATPGSAATPTAGAAATGGGSAAAAPAGAGINPGPLELPKPGTYTARITRSGTTQGATINMSLSRVSSTVTNVTTTTTLANGSQQINSESWRPDGIYLLQTSYVYSGQRYDCPFRTPVLELKLPLAVGTHWSSSGSCSTAAPNATTTTLSLDAGVTGVARQTVGGESVATYVITGQLVTDTTGSYSNAIGGVTTTAQPFDQKTTSQLELYLDSAAGVDVHSISQSSVDTNGKSSSSSTDTVLTSLKPS